MSEIHNEASGLAAKGIKKTPIAIAVGEYVASLVGHTSSIYSGIWGALQTKKQEVSVNTIKLLESGEKGMIKAPKVPSSNDEDNFREAA